MIDDTKYKDQEEEPSRVTRGTGLPAVEPAELAEKRAAAVGLAVVDLVERQQLAQ